MRVARHLSIDASTITTIKARLIFQSGFFFLTLELARSKYADAKES